MAQTWNVLPAMVTIGGTNITGYVSHRFSYVNSGEATDPFAGISLVVLVKDAPSDAARTAALAACTTAEKALYAAENASRQTVREIRPQGGDTVTVALGSLSYTQNQVQSADVGGVRQL